MQMSVARTNRRLRYILVGLTACLLGVVLYWAWLGHATAWLEVGAVIGALGSIAIAVVIAVRSAGARCFKDLS
jgi:hypothetical protein